MCGREGWEQQGLPRGCPSEHHPVLGSVVDSSRSRRPLVIAVSPRFSRGAKRSSHEGTLNIVVRTREHELGRQTYRATKLGIACQCLELEICSSEFRQRVFLAYTNQNTKVITT
jgi:hypothetical protein